MKIRIKSIVACLSVGFAIVVAVISSFGSKDAQNVVSANVDALSSGEFNPVKSCEEYCRETRNFDCILETNAGFDITCRHMYPK